VRSHDDLTNVWFYLILNVSLSALTPADPDIEKTWVDKRLIGLRGTDV